MVKKLFGNNYRQQIKYYNLIVILVPHQACPVEKPQFILQGADKLLREYNSILSFPATTGNPVQVGLDSRLHGNDNTDPKTSSG